MSEMKKNGGTWDTREETKHIIGEGKEAKGGERIAEKGIRGAQERICFKFHFFLEVSMPKDQLGQSTRFDRTPTCDRQTDRQTDNQRDTAVCRFMASTALCIASRG